MLTMLHATTAEMTTLRMSLAIDATEGDTSRVCLMVNSPGKACLTAMSEVKSPIEKCGLLWRQLSRSSGLLQRVSIVCSSGPCATTLLPAATHAGTESVKLWRNGKVYGEVCGLNPRFVSFNQALGQAASVACGFLSSCTSSELSAILASPRPAAADDGNPGDSPLHVLEDYRKRHFVYQS